MNAELGTTMVIVAGEGIFKLDTILIDGQRWIVPEWIDGYPTEGFSRPARMIRVDLLPGSLSDDVWWVRDPMPRHVLDGQEVPPYEARLLPDLYFPHGQAGPAQ